MNTPVPEELELIKKRRVLERLKDRLAEREASMADLRADLEQFEAQYSMQVGRLYAEMDDIEAAIAEEEYRLVPDDEQIKKRAEELRRRAEESAARAAESAAGDAVRREPTAEAKKAYHELARNLHPDLALDPYEKEKRHTLMAELNAAYSAGDVANLDRMAREMRVSPDVITGETIGDKLVRTIRQLAQVRTRLRELDDLRKAAESSEPFRLRQRARQEAAEGRDLLKQTAARTTAHIKKAQRRLHNLRTVNAAAEEHVRDTYQMDISEFR